MDPHDKWCHNARCRAYGLPGEGHVVIHSREKERRYQCKRCRRTFTERKDTALYRAHKPEWLVVAVLTLCCPMAARSRLSSSPSIWTNVASPAGKESLERSAGEFMGTS